MSFQAKFNLTTAQICSTLKISESSLYRLRKEGVLRPGVHYRAQGYGSVKPQLRWDPESTEAALASPRDTQKIPAVENANDEDVTLVRYRVVIEEAIVSLEQFKKYNQSYDKAGYYEDVEEFFECNFEGWQMGCPSMMFDVGDLVQSVDGHGYIAFLGDVRSNTDDVVSLTDPDFDWKHDNQEGITLADNDYIGYWRKRREAEEG